MRTMFGRIRPMADQRGFSLAEVVIAVLLFSATVVGISGLVMTGASDVARGATDSAAANLAAKKLEEVRSYPFYKAYDGERQDIDDFYFNTNLSGDKNAQQLDNPKLVEDY
jgi:Tfp pilus assembly protein PilV